MFSFEIKYAKAADKFLRQHEDIRKIYEQDITKLMLNDHPESADLKRLKGKHAAYYRMRIGDFRVIYTVLNGKIIVVDTVFAGARGDIYKKIGGLKQ